MVKRVLAVLDVNLDETVIGTRSRLLQPLLGVPVLRRTILRLDRCKNLCGIAVACPEGQTGAVRDCVAGTSAVVVGHDAGPSPWRSLVRAARKWSLDGWRGGLGGSTVYDEFVDFRVLSALADRFSFDAAFSASPAAPLIDAGLTDSMVKLYASQSPDVRLVFTQAPPGLTGILLDVALIREMASANLPVGWLFSYKPENPRKDLVFEEGCLGVCAAVRQSLGRVIADTDSAWALLTQCLTDLGDAADAETIGQWLQARRTRFIPPSPREVEVELTTDDPFPLSKIRPRGKHGNRRGPMPPAMVGGIAKELALCDDALMTLGGFGDPVLHPQFPEVLALARPSWSGSSPAGVFGLAVVSTGVDLHAPLFDAMIDCGVDVLELTVDAWTPELYAQLHGAGMMDRVLRNIDLLMQRKQERQSAVPIIVASFTKCRANVHEMDAFHDGWISRLGSVLIKGYSDYAGTLPDERVVSMTPPMREPCRRIAARCLVLADGAVCACNESPHGATAIGTLPHKAYGGSDLDSAQTPAELRKIWTGSLLTALRKEHAGSSELLRPACSACAEWHRP